MSSIIQSSPLSFNPNAYLLTGTLEYPDVESVFFKEASGEIQVENLSFVNDLGHNPLNFEIAIQTIQMAVSVIFKEIKEKTVFDENSQFTNALKILGRSLVQLVPVLGNGILIVYDRFRKSYLITPSIEDNLKEVQGPVIGIAFDGRLIVTVPVAVANAAFESPLCDVFRVAKGMWIGLKQRQARQITQNIIASRPNISNTTLDLAHDWERFFNTPYSARSNPILSEIN